MVWVAVYGGAEASLEAADVYQADTGVAPVVDITRLARHAGWTIRVCLAVSISYSITDASVAMAVVLNALIAAVIMPISSIVVVLIVMRSIRNRQITL